MLVLRNVVKKRKMFVQSSIEKRVFIIILYEYILIYSERERTIIPDKNNRNRKGNKLLNEVKVTYLPEVNFLFCSFEKCCSLRFAKPSAPGGLINYD